MEDRATQDLRLVRSTLAGDQRGLRRTRGTRTRAGGQHRLALRDPPRRDRGRGERGFHQGLRQPAPVPAGAPVLDLALPAGGQPRDRPRTPRPAGAGPTPRCPSSCRSGAASRRTAGAARAARTRPRGAGAVAAALPGGAVPGLRRRDEDRRAAARTLGLPQGTIKTRLMRGREALRKDPDPQLPGVFRRTNMRCRHASTGPPSSGAWGCWSPGKSPRCGPTCRPVPAARRRRGWTGSSERSLQSLRESVPARDRRSPAGRRGLAALRPHDLDEVPPANWAGPRASPPPAWPDWPGALVSLLPDLRPLLGRSRRSGLRPGRRPARLARAWLALLELRSSCWAC